MVAARDFEFKKGRQSFAQYTAENARWLEFHLAKLPPLWGESVRAKYERISKKSEREASEYVLKISGHVHGSVNIGLDDDDIVTLASELAARCKNAFANYVYLGKSKDVFFEHWAFEECFALLKEYGIKQPELHLYSLEGLRLRLECHVWWLKKLRVSHAKARELAAIDAGFVHKHKQIYVSDDTLVKRAEGRARSEKMLKSIKIKNEQGQELSLHEAAAAGMANPENRVKELITRVKGLQELGEKYAHLCMFVTMTAPSKYHATLSNGSKNPKYGGYTPTQTQAYMNKQWSLCRALASKHGVKFYGLRVVEPHHDATPHWHMALWVKTEEDYKALQTYIYDCFLHHENAEPNERGAAENRLQFVKADSRGAVGYILKYIYKNMQGHGIKNEMDSESAAGLEIESKAACSRVEAWASVWGIRQFQQIGGHSVSVWRELRRVEEDKLEGVKQLSALMRAWRAAQKEGLKRANYADFVEAMGGLDTSMRESEIKLDDDFIQKMGRYGLDWVRLIKGVRERFGGRICESKRLEWVRVEGESGAAVKIFKQLNQRVLGRVL